MQHARAMHAAKAHCVHVMRHTHTRSTAQGNRHCTRAPVDGLLGHGDDGIAVILNRGYELRHHASRARCAARRGPGRQGCGHLRVGRRLQRRARGVLQGDCVCVEGGGASASSRATMQTTPMRLTKHTHTHSKSSACPQFRSPSLFPHRRRLLGRTKVYVSHPQAQHSHAQHAALPVSTRHDHAPHSTNSRRQGVLPRAHTASRGQHGSFLFTDRTRRHCLQRCPKI